MEQDFKVIETQEQLDSIIKGRVDREKKNYTDKINSLEEENKKLQKDLENLNLELSKKQTEIEEINTKSSEKDKEIENFKLEQMRFDTAFEYGIPRSFASRLKGNTKEELVEDAKSVSETFKKLTPDPPVRSTEPSTVSGLDAGYASMAENILKGD